MRSTETFNTISTLASVITTCLPVIIWLMLDVLLWVLLRISLFLLYSWLSLSHATLRRNGNVVCVCERECVCVER